MPNKQTKKHLHHIIYELPDHKKRQGDLTILLDPGVHQVISDVQYSIAKDDLNAGLCLIFEGFKRLVYCLQTRETNDKT